MEQLPAKSLSKSNEPEDTNTPNPIENISLKELREKLDEEFDKLDIREKQMLKFRFGIDDGCNHSYNEIAEKFNLSPDRVRQIVRKALTILRVRDELASGELKSYLEKK